MTHDRSPDLERSIAQVEKRIELRRARIARHVEDVREQASLRAKPLALLGVCAFAAAGFYAGKRRAPPPNARAGGAIRKAGLLAGIASAVQGVLTLSTSPLVRAAWNGYMRRRARG